MKFLIVIDMQNDFITGSLPAMGGVEIVESVKAKIKKCREEGYHIIFTRDTHDEKYLESLEGKYIPIPHCIKSTSGWEIVDGLSNPEDDVLDKPTFGSTELPALIKIKAGLKPVEEIHIIGVCTDVCVISNAMILKANFYNNTEIYVDSTCCAGVTPESHERALGAINGCNINVI